MLDKSKYIKVLCPFCGYKMPLSYTSESQCKGIVLKCKGRHCKKLFELQIENGEQRRV